MSDEARVIGAILAATVELDAPLKRELAREFGNRELLKFPERALRVRRFSLLEIS